MGRTVYLAKWRAEDLPTVRRSSFSDKYNRGLPPPPPNVTVAPVFVTLHLLVCSALSGVSQLPGCALQKLACSFIVFFFFFFLVSFVYFSQPIVFGFCFALLFFRPLIRLFFVDELRGLGATFLVTRTQQLVQLAQLSFGPHAFSELLNIPYSYNTTHRNTKYDSAMLHQSIQYAQLNQYGDAPPSHSSLEFCRVIAARFVASFPCMSHHHCHVRNLSQRPAWLRQDRIRTRRSTKTEAVRNNVIDTVVAF